MALLEHLNLCSWSTQEMFLPLGVHPEGSQPLETPAKGPRRRQRDPALGVDQWHPRRPLGEGASRQRIFPAHRQWELC